MKRPVQNFVVDIAIFVAFIVLAATGLLMVLVLPPGSHETALWGLGRHGWGDIHFWVATGLVTLVALHLILHWRWIVCMVKGKSRSDNQARSRVALGLVALMVMVGLVVAPFLTPTAHVEEALGNQRGEQREHEEQGPSRGTITLGEIEYVTGVPLDYLVRELDLPAPTSPDETLRKMQKRYGVDIEVVRHIINTYEASPSTMSMLETERREQLDPHHQR